MDNIDDYLNISNLIADYAPIAIKIAAIIVVFLVVKFLWKQLLKKYEKSWDEEQFGVLQLLTKSGNIIIGGLAIIITLSTLGINMAALIAGLGLGGFALGFALKDSVSNLLSGVLVLIYKPFKTGDKIKVAGVVGEVKSIDLRYTNIEGEDEDYLVPNKKVFSDPITIYKNEKE